MDVDQLVLNGGLDLTEFLLTIEYVLHGLVSGGLGVGARTFCHL